MFLLKKSDLTNIINELAKSYDIYGSMIEKESGQVFFDRINNPPDLEFNAPIPSIPPKHVVFPQLETIIKYKYDKEAQKAEILAAFNDKPRALVGLRSCDLAGILCLDRFFLGQEFVDEVYMHHRRKMFIVTNTCVLPFKSCFCVCTDSGPSAREGFDLNMTDLGDNYLVEVGSEKGKDFIKKFNLPAASAKDAEAKQAKVDYSVSKFDSIATDSKAWVSRVMNRVTTGFIKDEVWEHIGNQCFECGACSFVCPSCSCFNIEDVNCGPGSTDRLRTWDSCSYEGYSRMAGGHNPRRPVEDRRNKRFFCKLSYSQSTKYLRPGCVGCGRCAWVCPGDIGLPNVVTNIRREIQG
jgi:ferredoxin